MSGERWHELAGGRTASSLGRRSRIPGGPRGFIVLGPATEPGRIRPTVAYGVVKDDEIKLTSGVLTAEELEELRRFWWLTRG